MSPTPDSDPSLGQCAQIACIWEATARKAGNVHRFADFDDVSYIDFLLSALAIGPVIEQAAQHSVGTTVLEAVRATNCVTRTNTNLGIVLLLAPLAKANSPMQEAIADVLNALTAEDARLVYEAIRLARPGGLGKVVDQDVRDAPTETLREVMLLAADRDRIARQYVCNFADVFDMGMPALREGWQRYESVEAAVIHCQLCCLAQFPDSLIARKRGVPEAEEASSHAREVLAIGGLGADGGRRRFAQLDRWLRGEGHARNPGTTADLVTACLFIALRERTMDLLAPFPSTLL